MSEESCGSRQSAKSVLEHKYNREQKKANALGIILQWLRWEDLSEEQEADLWAFFWDLR